MRLNSIETTRNGRGTVLFTAYGTEANSLMLNHREELIACVENGGENRYFVFEGATLRAAQSTESGAVQFLKPGYVLLDTGEKAYTVCVQCTDASTGTVADFVARIDGDGKRRAVSPLFDSLAELFPWMKANGWAMVEHVGDQFIPWRAVKELAA